MSLHVAVGDPGSAAEARETQDHCFGVSSGQSGMDAAGPSSHVGAGRWQGWGTYTSYCRKRKMRVYKIGHAGRMHECGCCSCREREQSSSSNLP